MWIINRDMISGQSANITSKDWKQNTDATGVPYIFRLVAQNGTHHYQGYNTEKNVAPLVVARPGFYKIIYKYKGGWKEVI